MSNHGWLRGEYKIPVKEWTWFKRNLIAEMKFLSLEKYNKAVKIWELIKEKKLKSKDIILFLDNHLNKHEKSSYWRDMIKSSLLKENKLKKPTKKDFPKFNSTSTLLEDDELSIRIDNKTKIVHFMSEDNSYSQDACLECHLGKVFMKYINRIKWTSKTGGYLRYYDEHCRDNGLEAKPMYIQGKYKKKKYSPISI